MATRFARHERAAVVLLVILGVPVLADNAKERLDEVRARLAAPTTAEFQSMVVAVSALPANALIVAAPELAERLPAFTPRHVLAALDRSTIVFSGNRTEGEARLRARAALMSGDSDADALARAAGVQPTHAVYDPRAKNLPHCGAVLYRSDAYGVCELAMDDHATRPARSLESPSDLPLRIVAEGECTGLTPAKRDPWAAAPPALDCTFEVPELLRDREYLYLRVDAVTGRAADELRIMTRDEGVADVEQRTTVRLTVGAFIALRLPPLQSNRLDVRIESSFLPVVRTTQVALASH
jgi:hypothetical protein